MSERQQPGADEPDPWARFAFTDEEAARAREAQRRGEEDRARRLFGDRAPFAIPDVDTEAEPGDTPFPETTGGAVRWEYYLVDREGSGRADRDGQVVRVLSGRPRSEGFLATFHGGWVATDVVARLLGGSGSGDAVPIGEDRARELLTRWTAQRRLVRLPEGLVPLGDPLSGNVWDYFLLGLPGGGDDLDVSGTIARHRPGRPYAESYVLVDGGWHVDDGLRQAWEVGGSQRAVFPVQESVARWLMTLWVERGRLLRLPGDVALSPSPWSATVGGPWAYFVLRRPDPPGRPIARGTGTLHRYRVGGTLTQGFALMPPGVWTPTRELFSELVLQRGRRTVEPVTEDAARRLVARLLADRVLSAVPEGLSPADGSGSA